MVRLRGTSVFASLLVLVATGGCRASPEVDPGWASDPLPSASGEVDQRMADVGAELFAANCSACHYIGGDDPEAGLGPNLAGVTERREVEWIRAMIARPDSMLDADPVAAGLYREYGIRMLNVNATPAEVRALVEFLWRADRGDVDATGGA